MACSFFLIPGNIKQLFIPFVLNRDSRLHKYVGSSTDLKTEKGAISPLLFTYRQYPGVNFAGGKGDLAFYPLSMKDVHFNKDVSFLMLYGMDAKQLITTNSLTIQDVISHLPGVLIREFLPDTRLDLCINMFVDMMSNMTKLFAKKDSDSGDKNKDEDASFLRKLLAASWYTIKYMVGATNPDFYDDLGKPAKLNFSSYNEAIYLPGQSNMSPGYYVMTFPYTLYYMLLSCVTTNIYEIPAVDSDKKLLMSGGGNKGWGDGSDIMGAGGFRMSSLLGKLPVVGNIANMLLGNIGINYMPWWNADSGASTVEPEINIKFDLFNDSADAAKYNFIFVNTIVPNNKWILYNMFLHSSSLYDIKIEGINRLFACSGDINVTYQGVLRDPSKKFIEDLVKLHANKNMSNAFLQNILTNKLIKIPDVYTVSMKFLSLLPANFNNYIFNYALNSGHLVNYGNHVYDSSAIADMLPNAISKYFTKVKAVWDAGDDKVGDSSNSERMVDLPLQQPLLSNSLSRNSTRLNEVVVR